MHRNEAHDRAVFSIWTDFTECQNALTSLYMARFSKKGNVMESLEFHTHSNSPLTTPSVLFKPMAMLQLKAH